MSGIVMQWHSRSTYMSVISVVLTSTEIRYYSRRVTRMLIFNYYCPIMPTSKIHAPFSDNQAYREQASAIAVDADLVQIR